MKNEEIIQVLESCLDRAKDLRRYYRERADSLENFADRMTIVDHEIQALREAVTLVQWSGEDDHLRDPAKMVWQTLTDLRRLSVQTGSLACLGCGREHSCGVHGCRILRDAMELITALEKR